MAVRQQCLVPAKATNNPQGGSDTSILWAAIPSIPTFERCSRKLEGRKQEKDVVIRTSRLMIDAHSWVQNPAYRHTISLNNNDLKVFKVRKDINDLREKP